MRNAAEQTTTDVRDLDEWMYALHTVSEQLDPAAAAEPLELLQKVLDEMREKRAAIKLRRHNETGY